MISMINEGKKWDAVKGHVKKNWGKYAAGAVGLAAAGGATYAYKNPGKVGKAIGNVKHKFGLAKDSTNKKIEAIPKKASSWATKVREGEAAEKKRLNPVAPKSLWDRTKAIFSSPKKLDPIKLKANHLTLAQQRQQAKKLEQAKKPETKPETKQETKPETKQQNRTTSIVINNN